MGIGKTVLIGTGAGAFLGISSGNILVYSLVGAMFGGITGTMGMVIGDMFGLSGNKNINEEKPTDDNQSSDEQPVLEDSDTEVEDDSVQNIPEPHALGGIDYGLNEQVFAKNQRITDDDIAQRKLDSFIANDKSKIKDSNIDTQSLENFRIDSLNMFASNDLNPSQSLAGGGKLPRAKSSQKASLHAQNMIERIKSQLLPNKTTFPVFVKDGTQIDINIRYNKDSISPQKLKSMTDTLQPSLDFLQDFTGVYTIFQNEKNKPLQLDFYSSREDAMIFGGVNQKQGGIMNPITDTGVFFKTTDSMQDIAIIHELIGHGIGQDKMLYTFTDTSKDIMSNKFLGKEKGQFPDVYKDLSWITESLPEFIVHKTSPKSKKFLTSRMGNMVMEYIRKNGNPPTIREVFDSTIFDSSKIYGYGVLILEALYENKNRYDKDVKTMFQAIKSNDVDTYRTILTKFSNDKYLQSQYKQKIFTIVGNVVKKVKQQQKLSGLQGQSPTKESLNIPKKLTKTQAFESRSFLQRHSGYTYKTMELTPEQQISMNLSKIEQKYSSTKLYGQIGVSYWKADFDGEPSYLEYTLPWNKEKFKTIGGKSSVLLRLNMDNKGTLTDIKFFLPKEKVVKKMEQYKDDHLPFYKEIKRYFK